MLFAPLKFMVLFYAYNSTTFATKRHKFCSLVKAFGCTHSLKCVFYLHLVDDCLLSRRQN